MATDSKQYLSIPVAHKEIAYAGEQQQYDCETQLELLIFVFVGKSDNGCIKYRNQKIVLKLPRQSKYAGYYNLQHRAILRKILSRLDQLI